MPAKSILPTPKLVASMANYCHYLLSACMWVCDLHLQCETL